MPPIRQEALWVVILPDGWSCPMAVPAQHDLGFSAVCRGRLRGDTARHRGPDYDADDYAHDMADFVGSRPERVDFSIGLVLRWQVLLPEIRMPARNSSNMPAQDGVGTDCIIFWPPACGTTGRIQAMLIISPRD